MDKKKLAYIAAGALLLWFILRPRTASATENSPLPVTDDIPLPPVTDESGFYVVKPGDSWSTLAAGKYGDWQWWPFLWDTNRRTVSYPQPDMLPVGANISVPQMPPASASYRNAIFARAQTHAEWYMTNQRLRQTGGRPRPIPSSVMTFTPMEA
jgi:hypothetical protein